MFLDITAIKDYKDITTLQMQNVIIKEKLDEIEHQLTTKRGA